MCGKNGMLILAISALCCTKGLAADQVYPTAIFTFEERGAAVKGLGSKVSDLLFASLAAEPDIYLVERQELQKLLDEAELNLSGVINPSEAIQVGRLTGAKLILTGSVIDANRQLFLVGKIISTETGRVLGQSVKGSMNDDLGALVEQLAAKMNETIGKNAKDMVAQPVSAAQRIAAITKKLGDAERPSLGIHIAERHVGQVAFDPAAETEMTLMSRETGFEVKDAGAAGPNRPDLIIQGEGLSEFAARHGNIVSVKARVEVKAIDPATEKVIATDRQTVVVADLSEQIAGKKALQEAAAIIAERLLPKLVH